MTVFEQYAVSEFTEVCFCASKKKKGGQLRGDGGIDK